MALIDIECPQGHVSEVYRAVKDWPATPACPECGAETEQIHRPRATTWTVDPIVVFKAPDGTFRFPGDANGLSAKNYAKQGFERVEIRGAAEMRRFESVMGRHEYSRAMRRAENLQKMREAREKELRSELRSQMSGMSEFGKAVARAAMARNDGRPRERAQESGFHSEVYSSDRSNRMESRDAQGRRHRD